MKVYLFTVYCHDFEDRSSLPRKRIMWYLLVIPIILNWCWCDFYRFHFLFIELCIHHTTHSRARFIPLVLITEHCPFSSLLFACTAHWAVDKIKTILDKLAVALMAVSTLFAGNPLLLFGELRHLGQNTYVSIFSWSAIAAKLILKQCLVGHLKSTFGSRDWWSDGYWWWQVARDRELLK